MSQNFWYLQYTILEVENLAGRVKTKEEMMICDRRRHHREERTEVRNNIESDTI